MQVIRVIGKCTGYYFLNLYYVWCSDLCSSDRRTESGACEPTMHKNHAKGVIKKHGRTKSTLLVPEATFAGPNLSTQIHAFELTWHGILLRALKTIAPTSF